MSVNNNYVTTGIVEFAVLDENIQKLINEATEARNKSYSPYSKFPVGACLETEEGILFRGCNVENAVLGLTICAEQAAIVKAITEGYRNYKNLAVVAYQEHNFTTPCGSCRQFLSEFNANLKIYVTKPGYEKVLVTSVKDLLPYMFDGQI